MEQQEKIHTSSIEILKLWQILWGNKYKIVIISVVGGILSAIYAFNAEKYYKSSATFISLSSNSSNKLGTLSGLATLAGINIPTATDNQIDIQVVLKSRGFTERIVNQMNLVPLVLERSYDPKTGVLAPKEAGLLEKIGLYEKKEKKPIKDINLRKQYVISKVYSKIKKEVLTIKRDKESGLYSITIVLKDPFVAASVANRYLENLESYLQKHTLTTTKRSRVFIESQMQKTSKKLAFAEEQLKDFSIENGMFSVDEQASLVFQTIGKIKGEIMLEEVKLETIVKLQGEDNHEVNLSRLRLDALKKRLKEFEYGGGATQNRSFDTLSFKELPSLSLQFGRLKREVLIQQEIYKMLRTQLETAKIEEAKDPNAIQIIDIAVPSELPFRPQRLIIIILGVFFSFTLAMFFVFGVEFIKKLRIANGKLPDIH